MRILNLVSCGTPYHFFKDNAMLGRGSFQAVLSDAINATASFTETRERF
jgi:hypothetical protein